MRKFTLCFSLKAQTYIRYLVKSGSLQELIRQAEHEIEQKTFIGNLQIQVSIIRKKLNNTLAHYPDIRQQLFIQSEEGAMVIPIHRGKLVSHTRDFQFQLEAG